MKGITKIFSLVLGGGEDERKGKDIGINGGGFRGSVSCGGGFEKFL